MAVVAAINQAMGALLVPDRARNRPLPIWTPAPSLLARIRRGAAERVLADLGDGTDRSR